MLLVLSPPVTLTAHKNTQVLRYTALLTGVGYGFSHQASISARAKIAHIDREFENQASLIAKAKAEWVKKTMPKEAKEGSGEFAFSSGGQWLGIPLLSELPGQARSLSRSENIGATPGEKISQRGWCI